MTGGRAHDEKRQHIIVRPYALAVHGLLQSCSLSSLDRIRKQRLRANNAFIFLRMSISVVAGKAKEEER